MAFAMAALRAEGTVAVRDCANIDTSFPRFAAVAAGVGLGVGGPRE
jgi:3-phosphoshikimate 1-carboxyvinyltransferase